MEIVIKIPDVQYEYLTRIANAGKEPLGYLERVIMRGTPLPKGHGDLISKEQAIELVEFYQLNPQHFSFVDFIDEIKDEKPIIEADRGGEDEDGKSL